MADATETTGFTLLDDFRALVRYEIGEALKRDGYHKRHEGTIAYQVVLPPVVDWRPLPDPFGLQQEMTAEHQLSLYCYVIGPARQYEWTASTAEELFAKATADFKAWVAEEVAEHG